jgi:hypothetical protein
MHVHAGFAHADPQSQLGPHTHGEQVHAGFAHLAVCVMPAVYLPVTAQAHSIEMNFLPSA